tara:strand:- start:5601 stop:7904 length:2304 start_codon:yes stop_codon:yes gene_type:complete
MDTIQVLFGSKNISGAPLGGGLYFNANNTLTFYDSGSSANFTTSAVYRDYSAWYHLAVTLDIAGGDATLYVNGEEAGTGSVSGSSSINSGGEVHHIAREVSVTGYFAGVYLADMYFVDGAIVTPNTNFIETDGTTGQLKPKAYTVSGTNGFHLDFKDSADLGNDAAGSNDFAESGLVASDQMNDRPTNNYCVWNPLANRSASTLSEGNLKVVAVGANSASLDATINLPKSGKWYWESHQDGVVGIEEGITYEGKEIAVSGVGVYSTNVYALGSAVVTGISRSAGDILQFAVDSTEGRVWVGKNDTWWTAAGGTDGDPSAGTDWTAEITTPVIEEWVASLWDVTSSATRIYNFGQDPFFAGSKSSGQDTSQSEFFYAPPTDFLALSTANLPTPTIAKGHEYFNTLLYDDGTGAKTFGAADNLSPDLVWVKSRGSSNNHKLTDSLRGVQKSMESDTVDAEVTESSNVGVTVFGADGFTIGSSSSTTGPYADQTGTGMVGWGWKSATVGSGGSGVNWAEQYDATAGISIVKWSGNSSVNISGNEQTISHYDHGDTAMIIAKARTAHGVTEYMDTGGWIVWHKDLTSEDYFLTLNTSNAEDYWSSSYMKVISDITDTSIKVGNGADYNTGNPYALNFDGSGSWTDVEDYIGYFFSEVAGYSKFGSYVGNGSADGPFAWSGFRPSYVLIRRAGTTGDDWTVYDSARSSYNAVDDIFYANTSGAENPDDTSHAIDFLSNGFKCRGTSAQENSSGAPYIFAAFAEQPFAYAAAR